MVPNILHFVFGMTPDFGGKPFSLVHYLSIKSAVGVNKPDAAVFHYQYEPEGPWWQKAKPLLTLNKVLSPDSFMGQPLHHFAHKADVIRLQALKETGGIYMDLDTISIQPLTPLLVHSFVMGEELQTIQGPKNWRQKFKTNLRRKRGLAGASDQDTTGLCNAILLSEKDSVFVNLWLDEYKSFRSKGRDKYWNEHSVMVPLILAKKYPEAITKVNPYAFLFPLYDPPGLKSLFEEKHEFPGAYLHHLWESFSWDQYLSKLTPEKIRTEGTTYNLIARKYL